MISNKKIAFLLSIIACAAWCDAFGAPYKNNALSHTPASLDSNLTPSIEEEITDQDADFYFYNKNGEKIANVSYHLSDASTMYLSYLKIYERSDRGSGLGRKLFTYFVKHIKKTNPAITTITWRAVALDPDYLSQENLEKWYEARGGIKIEKNPYGSSKFKLNIKDFKPERDLSSLYDLEIKEEFMLEGTTTIALKKQLTPVAKLGYYLSVKNDHYSIKINNVTVEPGFINHRSTIEQVLQNAIKRHIKAKRWLRNLTPNITTNSLIPQFNL